MSNIAIHKKIVALEARMADAVASLDFEAAAKLRNDIEHLRGQMPTDRTDDDLPMTTTVSQPPPGAMGLGTHLPVVAPPKNWKRPKKPDPMTSNTKPRRGG